MRADRPNFGPVSSALSRLNINIGERRVFNMNWIVIGLALAGVVALVTVLRRASGGADLGTVSHQWIAEHRLDSTEHSRR